jgi:hypothetical protein
MCTFLFSFTMYNMHEQCSACGSGVRLMFSLTPNPYSCFLYKGNQTLITTFLYSNCRHVIRPPSTFKMLLVLVNTGTVSVNNEWYSGWLWSVHLRVAPLEREGILFLSPISKPTMESQPIGTWGRSSGKSNWIMKSTNHLYLLPPLRLNGMVLKPLKQSL